MELGCVVWNEFVTPDTWHPTDEEFAIADNRHGRGLPDWLAAATHR